MYKMIEEKTKKQKEAKRELLEYVREKMRYEMMHAMLMEIKREQEN